MQTTLLYSKREVVTYNQGRVLVSDEPVVREIPLTIMVNEIEYATLNCSPADYEELAAGYLLSEGVINQPSDILAMSSKEEEGLFQVHTCTAVPNKEERYRRNMDGCGRQRKTALYFIKDASRLEPIKSTVRFSIPHLLHLVGLMDESSNTFRLTGGVHGVALGDSNGLLVMYEDIGRHNAVDKVLGYALLNRIPVDDKCLVLSGRVASEILIKAAHSGIPLVLSRSAPMQLALELADELNMTVVGFARGQRLNIYTHPERITYQ